MITLSYIIILISCVGIYYVNWKHNKVGFLFHAVSALLWAIYDWKLGACVQTATMVFSSVTSIVGYLKWRHDGLG